MRGSPVEFVWARDVNSMGFVEGDPWSVEQVTVAIWDRQDLADFLDSLAADFREFLHQVPYRHL